MGMTLQNSLSDLSAQAIEQFRKATLASEAKAENILLKTTTQGVTTSTGLTWFDLQVPAKNLFPVLTPLRNSIPRVSGGGGTATNWRAVTAINAAGVRGAVPEGKRNAVQSITAVPRSASYKTIGLEDLVTIEAELAARGLEDIRATTAQRLLWSTMIEEEIFILGGNVGVALGTCSTPTLVTAASGGSIAAGTYVVRCVALTMHGYLAGAVSAAGVPGLVTVTTATASSFTYGGGSSIKSASATTAALTGSLNVISAYVTAVNGAVAYAWFVDDGASGALTLQAITTINSVRLTSLSTAYQALSTTFDADHSESAYSFDGVLYQAFTSGSAAYIATLATGTPGTGTGLTSDGAGGIVEIDAMLKSIWDNYRLGPSVLYVNAQESLNITKKVLGTGTLNRFVTDNPGGGLIDLTAGARLRRYVNKFGLGGQVEIPIEIHPYLPPGTLVAWTERLPYPLPNVQNVVEMRLQRDYYQMEWPMRERQYESGVYFNGVLAHYFPPSIGIITNIGNA